MPDDMSMETRIVQNARKGLKTMFAKEKKVAAPFMQRKVEPAQVRTFWDRMTVEERLALIEREGLESAWKLRGQ